MKEKKKAYVVGEDDADYNIVVVALNIKDAKKIALDDASELFEDAEYINIHAKWQKNVRVDDLPIGVIDPIEGLNRGLYSCYEELKCPNCGRNDETVYSDGLGGTYCSSCEGSVG